MISFPQALLEMRLDRLEIAEVTGHAYQKYDGVFVVYSDSAEPGSAKFIRDAWGVPSPIVGCLEEQMELDHGDWLELQEGENWCHLTGRDGGETQYGRGYGDTFTIPASWEYERIDEANARRLIKRWHQCELERLQSEEPFGEISSPGPVAHWAQLMSRMA